MFFILKEYYKKDGRGSPFSRGRAQSSSLIFKYYYKTDSRPKIALINTVASVILILASPFIFAAVSASPYSGSSPTMCLIISVASVMLVIPFRLRRPEAGIEP